MLVTHGEAAKFVTTTLQGTKFAKEKVAHMAKVQSALESLQKAGSHAEVCAIAMKRAKTAHTDVHPFATIQDNVFGTLIVLWNSGHAYIPVNGRRPEAAQRGC